LIVISHPGNFLFSPFPTETREIKVVEKEKLMKGEEIPTMEKNVPLLIEIDLKRRRMIAKKRIFPDDIFFQEDLEKTRQIMRESKTIPFVEEKLGKIKVRLPLSDIKLRKRGGIFEPTISSKKMEIFYQSPDIQWVGEVDLEKRKIMQTRLIKENK